MGKKMNNPYELAKNILQSVSDESQPIPANEGFRSIDLYGSSVHGKMKMRIRELSRMQEFVIVRANATIEHIIRRHRLKLSSRFIHF